MPSKNAALQQNMGLGPTCNSLDMVEEPSLPSQVGLGCLSQGIPALCNSLFKRPVPHNLLRIGKLLPQHAELPAPERMLASELERPNHTVPRCQIYMARSCSQLSLLLLCHIRVLLP